MLRTGQRSHSIGELLLVTVAQKLRFCNSDSRLLVVQRDAGKGTWPVKISPQQCTEDASILLMMHSNIHCNQEQVAHKIITDSNNST